MASVWKMKRGKADAKMLGHITPDGAVKAFNQLKVSLAKTLGAGWGLRDVGPYEFLVMRPDGKPDGGIYIEFNSPPSKPGKGEVYVQRKEA